LGRVGGRRERFGVNDDAIDLSLLVREGRRRQTYGIHCEHCFVLRTAMRKGSPPVRISAKIPPDAFADRILLQLRQDMLGDLDST
jgi:hypothetical protein